MARFRVSKPRCLILVLSSAKKESTHVVELKLPGNNPYVDRELEELRAVLSIRDVPLNKLEGPTSGSQQAPEISKPYHVRTRGKLLH
ncbi:hypothetical protein K443DRAFT_678460 [Laccaria amethystina LaAM-08-1]|uniref:Uncharacterized protein n=1 Tax=Laccaria amethystina LaAM-08-1 TaxID=1095629 RepID=A0A0C9WRP7_9AGAR|nr:hypothetical protein K443DRAFT_678460 [Laccaria amethystina LaAM-08-1]